MAYDVRFAPKAEKALGKLDRPIAQRIADAVTALAEEPRPAGCKKLSGEDGTYRIRVGDYRVLYSIDDGELTVLVVDMAHRREVYR